MDQSLRERIQSTDYDVTLSVRGEQVIENPSREVFRRELTCKRHDWHYVGELWLRVRPSGFWSESGTISEHVSELSSGLLFYLGIPEGPVMSYHGPNSVGYFSKIGELLPPEEIIVDDSGCSDWILDKKYCLSVDETLDLAFKLIAAKYLDVDASWELNPEPS